MHFILLFSLFFAAANAFSHAGSFERMYVYYAMKIDAYLHEGAPRYIVADGCANGCTFDQFIRVLDGGHDRIASSSSPDVSSTASELTELGLNNRIKVNKVMGTDMEYRDMLLDVADHLVRWGPQIRQSGRLTGYKNAAEEAVRYALEARQLALDDLGIQALKKKGYAVSVRDANWPGYDNPAQSLSLSRTIRKNTEDKNGRPVKGATKIENKIREIWDRATRADNSHNRMIDTLRSVLAKLQACAAALMARGVEAAAAGSCGQPPSNSTEPRGMIRDVFVA
jgi:hypothetical protein